MSERTRGLVHGANALGCVEWCLELGERICGMVHGDVREEVGMVDGDEEGMSGTVYDDEERDRENGAWRWEVVGNNARRRGKKWQLEMDGG